MTHLVGINDPGRAGGSWLAYIGRVHPVGMRILGEAHVSTQLDFPYPCPPREYDDHIIAFLKSQTLQGVRVAGIIKSFWKYTRKFILDNGGRICTVLRNPMEVVGFKMHKKPKPGLKPSFGAHVLHYKKVYEVRMAQSGEQPVVRLEDLNRSLGGDGQFFKSFMEWLTKTPFPQGYIEHIQRHYLPGYYYGLSTVRVNGIVVDVHSAVIRCQPWRMQWGDDPRPGEFWESWSEEERELFAEGLGPICEKLGYNYTDRPGFTEKDWSLASEYAWGKLADTLEPVPYDRSFTGRELEPDWPWLDLKTIREPCKLPIWKGE